MHAPRWFNGRTGIIGDAAYCPTPLTGMGTTLAITGAYYWRASCPGIKSTRDTFTAYEKRMRPFVEKIQKLPPGVPWLAHPKSKFGVAVVNTVAGILASRPVKTIGKLFSSKDEDVTKDEIELPEFGGG